VNGWPCVWWTGKERTDLLKSLGQEADAAREPLRFVTLACNRTLTPSSKVELVFGKGVRTPPTGNNAQGIANTVEKRFRFQVRESFTAQFQLRARERPKRLSADSPHAVELQCAGASKDAGRNPVEVRP
jgi:hypothetical protein